MISSRHYQEFGLVENIVNQNIRLCSWEKLKYSAPNSPQYHYFNVKRYGNNQPTKLILLSDDPLDLYHPLDDDSSFELWVMGTKWLKRTRRDWMLWPGRANAKTQLGSIVLAMWNTYTFSGLWTPDLWMFILHKKPTQTPFKKMTSEEQDHFQSYLIICRPSWPEAAMEMTGGIHLESKRGTWSTFVNKSQILCSMWALSWSTKS